MIVEDNDFKPEKYSVACHIICGGKIEKGEDKLTAIKREVQEETGLVLEKEDFKYIHTWNVVFNKKENNCNYSSFYYSLYQVYFENRPEIVVPKDELDEYDWFTPKEALKLSLVEDEDNVLKEIYKISI